MLTHSLPQKHLNNIEIFIHVNMPTFIHICTWSHSHSHTKMLTHMKIQIHSCTDKLTNAKMLMYSLAHEHIHTLTSTHQHAYMIACTYIFNRTPCMQTQICLCIHTYEYTQIHSYTWIYSYTHIHTHTDMFPNTPMLTHFFTC